MLQPQLARAQLRAVGCRKGKTDPETGFVVNLSALSRLMHEYVIDPCSNKV